MSLLRHRAIAVSLESTFRARRLADARAWFVRLTSLASDVELNEFTSHARVVRGDARSPTDVIRNAIIVITTSRRGSVAKARRRPAAGDWALDATIIGGLVPC